MDKKFVQNYLNDFVELVLPTTEVITALSQVKDTLVKACENGKKIIIVGNGGSAAIASHFSVDITKNAGIRCVNFNEPGLITCFSNDYGYERWVEKALEFYADAEDLAILISSSGSSKNIIRGAQKAKKMRLKLITFSGFDSDNPLRRLGDINFWADSKAYNIIEMVHTVWLVAIVDQIIGSMEYSA